MDGLFMNPTKVPCTAGNGITSLGARSIIENYVKEHEDKLDNDGARVVGFAPLSCNRWNAPCAGRGDASWVDHGRRHA